MNKKQAIEIVSDMLADLTEDLGRGRTLPNKDRADKIDSLLKLKRFLEDL